jgi:fructoselysine-6-P-deglycase FrlB-like protein
MAQDIKSQLDHLPAIKLQSTVNETDIAFVGSGDSFAAALAACYLSSGRPSCWHPADVISLPQLLDGHSTFFISESGKTRANIRAATAAKNRGITTVAVTADAQSPLAKICDRIVTLGFKRAGVTSGTLGFSATVLACAQIACTSKTIIDCPGNLREIYTKASETAKDISTKVHTRSAIVTLANSFLFPAAMYCALKFNEVFGSRAHAYPLEEFFHAPLFGLKHHDQVIVLGSKGDDHVLAKHVNGLLVDCTMPTVLESFFYAIFFVQHLALHIARIQGLRQCYFIRNKRRLKISSEVIY